MRWSVKFRFIAGLMAVIVNLTMITIPQTSHAADYQLWVKHNDVFRRCEDAGLTEYGPSDAFVVAARFYARCVGAGYEWNPVNQTFTLTKYGPYGARGIGYIAVQFTLYSSYVRIFHDGRLWAVFDVFASTGVIPHERPGDGANRIPLRFIDDAFRGFTRWTGGQDAVAVFEDGTPLDESPGWDRARIESNLPYMRDADGSISPPEEGYPLLPSTIQRLQFFAPREKASSEAAERAGIIHATVWRDFRFQIMNWPDELNNPIITVTSSSTGDNIVTYWNHSSEESAQREADLYDSIRNISGVTGTVASPSLAWLANYAKTHPEAFGEAAGASELSAFVAEIAGIAALVVGSVATIQAFRATQRAAALRSCIRQAVTYSKAHPEEGFHMGLRESGEGESCAVSLRDL